MESRIVAILGLTFLRILGFIFYILPPFGRSLLATGLALLIQWSGLRHEVIHSNLKIAYGNSLDRGVRDKMTFDAYKHLAYLVFEISMLLLPFGLFRRFIGKNVDFEGSEGVIQQRLAGKSVIIVSSHVGNWEILAAAGGIIGRLDVMIVTKKLKPTWLHDAIEKGRKHCSVLGTYEPKTMRDVMRHLKALGTIGFVLDQYAGPPVGVRVPLFGIPVGTPSVIAAVARRTKTVVFSAITYRKPNGRYSVKIRPQIPWKEASDATLEIAENTAKYNEIIEQDIKAHPDQWLWIHKRFKGDLSPLRESEWSHKRARA